MVSLTGVVRHYQNQLVSSCQPELNNLNDLPHCIVDLMTLQNLVPLTNVLGNVKSLNDYSYALLIPYMS